MKTKEEVMKDLYFLKEMEEIIIEMGSSFNLSNMNHLKQMVEDWIHELENNNKTTDSNGWIRIESEADLPKTQSISEEIHCFIKSSDNETIGMGKFSFGSFKTFFGNNYENITHYQPIVQPNKPLY